LIQSFASCSAAMQQSTNMLLVPSTTQQPCTLHYLFSFTLTLLTARVC
jgi:hypothetical protein